MENVSKNEYLSRNLLENLKKWVNRREIMAIKGPRQSGKTTLLKMLKEWLISKQKVNPKNIIFLTFEDRELLEKFSTNPSDFTRSFIGNQTDEKFYFLIDEFHYLEDGGQKLKLLYDTIENAKFIITGSSSLELTGKTGKFLVGRMFSFLLWPFSFDEFIRTESKQLSFVYQERAELLKNFIINGKNFKNPKADIFNKDLERSFEKYVIWGGYPEVIKAPDQETKKIILKNIFDTYISRDIIELLKIDDFIKFKKLVQLSALQIGNLINYDSLATDSQSYYKEVKRYLSVLEETFIISLLKPFFTSKITEIKKNPKIYLIDSGLRNYIVNNFNELINRSDTGQLVENVILQQLKTGEFNEYSIGFWRTISRAEVDFVLEQGKILLPLEVKYATFKSPKISRGFRNFIREYQPSRAVILTKNFWGNLKIDKTHIKFLPVWYL